MPKQYKKARQLNNLKAIQAAKLLGVSQPTLSAWEGERKSPSVENLENMANLYHVTTDFLLGRDEPVQDSLQPVPSQALPALHGRPVWSARYGWMLVNAIDRLLLLADGKTLPFADAGILSIAPPVFSEGTYPHRKPLSKSEVMRHTEIWLEPVSPDPDLRLELRGWYRPKGRWVENEYGNRFYLDTYEAKWLAFDKELV